jgi:hypothetical protein
MSLHTQLLRGVFALPVLLVLAVASGTAPAQPQNVRMHAAPHARVIVIAEEGRVAIVAHAGEE